jgi:PAS domain S-box-containing protein
VQRIERQLEVAQKITHIGSWEWDVRTNVVTWSDELYRIYGLEPRSCEITFEFFLARLVEADRARVQAAVGAALAQGSRFAYVEHIVRPDGTIRELDTIGEAARDGSDKVVGLIGTCRDVTEERKRDETIRLYADIVRNVQIGLGVWKVEAKTDASAIHLVAFNPEAERIASMPLGPWLGKALAEIVPYAAGGELEALLTRVAQDGLVHETVVLRSKDDRNPTRALAMKAFPLPGSCVGVALEDITAATRARRLQEAEQGILEMIATGTPLADILETLALVIEEHSPPTIASILLLDADGTHVKLAAAPHLPDAYNRAIDGQAIGPRAGSCGTAAFLKRPVFVSDIETDPLWEAYKELALAHGLRACWSTPIIATDGRVLGTFALYHKEPRTPTDRDREVIARATHLAGIAIESRQLEDQLRELSAHVESVREDERTGIAREIHDELGQALTALKMDLAWIARRSIEPATVSREALLEKIRGMSQMTDDVINQVRRISAELRPGVLDDLGLFSALEWQGQEFENRTGTTCRVHGNVGDAHFDRNLSTAVFRIFQEALTNVVRHAGASHVDVSLERREGWLHLVVSDDGKGITKDEAFRPKALGLLGMRERARRLGGSAVVEAADPCGTRVSLAIPVASSGASSGAPSGAWSAP